MVYHHRHRTQPHTKSANDNRDQQPHDTCCRVHDGGAEMVSASEHGSLKVDKYNTRERTTTRTMTRTWKWTKRTMGWTRMSMMTRKKEEDNKGKENNKLDKQKGQVEEQLDAYKHGHQTNHHMAADDGVWREWGQFSRVFRYIG
ncbi:hypothetical protein P3342_002068 [Pyrenophora teres f. teres]|nr:hypothetical protein P3342_002068 [Pyrenophora teres f. teres]